MTASWRPSRNAAARRDRKATHDAWTRYCASVAALGKRANVPSPSQPLLRTNLTERAYARQPTTRQSAGRRRARLPWMEAILVDLGRRWPAAFTRPEHLFISKYHPFVIFRHSFARRRPNAAPRRAASSGRTDLLSSARSFTSSSFRGRATPLSKSLDRCRSMAVAAAGQWSRMVGMSMYGMKGFHTRLR